MNRRQGDEASQKAHGPRGANSARPVREKNRRYRMSRMPVPADWSVSVEVEAR